MKYLTISIFLLSFCANQMRIMDFIAHFQKTYISLKQDMEKEQEKTNEKEELEKEAESFFSSNSIYSLSNIHLIPSKSHLEFFNSLYSNPYNHRDIKPPRCA